MGEDEITPIVAGGAHSHDILCNIQGEDDNITSNIAGGVDPPIILFVISSEGNYDITLNIVVVYTSL